MGLHAGIAHLDGSPISNGDREWLRAIHGADVLTDYFDTGFGVAWTDPPGSFRTNVAKGADDAVWVWNGRLDNRLELTARFRDAVEPWINEAGLAAAAFERGRESAFNEITGDWSIASWSPSTRELCLISEFMGVSPLYYAHDGLCVRWSSDLGALLDTRIDTSWDLDWFIGRLAFAHPPDRTPYRGIRTLTPGRSLSFTRGGSRSSVVSAPRFDASLRESPAEYAAELRRLFLESVRVRMAGEHVVWAQLSGGMDSSSVVCAATHLIRAGAADTERLAAVTHYSSSSPEWSETPFVKAVEQSCGLSTRMIDVDASLPIVIGGSSPDAPWPHEAQVAEQMLESGSRTILTGRYGDLMMGNDPFSVDTLVESLRKFQLLQFLSDSRSIARNGRLCIKELVQASVRILAGKESIRLNHPGDPTRFEADKLAQMHSLTPSAARMVGDLTPDFARLARELVPPERASFVASVLKVARNRRLQPKPGSVVDVAHPYMHRPILNLVCAMPIREWCRPGETRTLMREAFQGMVPARILKRKSKGYAAPVTIRALRGLAEPVWRNGRSLTLADLGVVDGDLFRERLNTAVNGSCRRPGNLHLLVALELWLRDKQENRTSPHAAGSPTVAA
jgi:asparagine synthase (glutamine-hydrolysing)